MNQANFDQKNVTRDQQFAEAVQVSNNQPDLSSVANQVSESKQGSWIKILIVFTILAVGAGFFGYQYGLMQNNSGPREMIDEEEGYACTMDAKICPDGSAVGRSGPNCEFDPCPVSETSVPEGWLTLYDETCNVTMPMPPDEDEYRVPRDPDNAGMYDEGAFWQSQVEELEIEQGQYFEHRLMAWFINPEWGGSGYVPGMVAVACRDNETGMDLESAVEQYSEFISELNVIDEDFYVVDENRVPLWNTTVAQLSYFGGMSSSEDKIYLVVTPERILMVSRIAYSDSPMVQTTTRQIFNGIMFHDLLINNQIVN